VGRGIPVFSYYPGKHGATITGLHPEPVARDREKARTVRCNYFIEMNKIELARNVAKSLTLGAWSQESIETTLLRRLPRPLHRLASAIGKELITELPALYAPSVNTVVMALLLNVSFDRAVRYCQRRGIWPDPDLTSPLMAPIAAFADLDVPQLPTVGALAEWLLLSICRLDYLADIHGRHEEHGETAINHYHYVLKQKKTNGIRVIEAPKQVLKSVQRKILRSIVDKVPNHVDAFGFVLGRNCLQGAARHASEEVVICFDLKDFFPSIGSGRIFGLFRSVGYPIAVARHLTALCTTATPQRILNRLSFDDRAHYRQPHLPQGSPASPGIANKVAFTLDRRLSALARQLNANYSRYADDLSFSGNQHIIETLMQAVPQIVRGEGFCLNAAKTRIMSHTARQVVTGVIVNKHLNVGRASFDQLKAVIHACGRSGDMRLNDPVFRMSLLGKIGWVEAVNPSRGQKLLHLLSAVGARVS
jgi:RNA-directed DNA polymerase